MPVKAASAPASVEEYLAALTPAQRGWIDELRGVIREVLPDATEERSYGIVAYKLGGRAVVWYAAYKGHYSMHPATDAMETRLGERLAPHRTGKGTLRFDPTQPVPRDLVREIVEIRRAEVESAPRRVKQTAGGA
jgi:uncharacterized protein YdhG (YjbR/CyaY superfamily)